MIFLNFQFANIIIFLQFKTLFYFFLFFFVFFRSKIVFSVGKYTIKSSFITIFVQNLTFMNLFFTTKKVTLLLCTVIFSVLSFAQKNLKEVINDKETILLDVRTPEEFNEGSPMGAINIPIEELPHRLNELSKDKDIVVFCKRGIRASKAEKILKNNNFPNVHYGKTYRDVKSMRVVNLDKEMNHFGEKPLVKNLRKTNKIEQVAIGLGKNGELPNHTTPVPTTLFVLEGELHIHINNEVIRLKKHDRYDIPEQIAHKVIGKNKKNLFILIKEL